MMSVFHRVGTPFMEFLYSWENKYKDKLMVKWKEDTILLDSFVYIGHDSHIYSVSQYSVEKSVLQVNLVENVNKCPGYISPDRESYLHVYEAVF